MIKRVGGISGQIGVSFTKRSSNCGKRKQDDARISLPEIIRQ
jgi:hypothetical protein